MVRSIRWLTEHIKIIKQTKSKDNYGFFGLEQLQQQLVNFFCKGLDDKYV